jgi:hypothetical protein
LPGLGPGIRDAFVRKRWRPSLAIVPWVAGPSPAKPAIFSV